MDYKFLKKGQIVICPADRGDPSYNGIVKAIGTEVYKTCVSNTEYVWVTIEHSIKTGKISVWPSNRLT